MRVSLFDAVLLSKGGPDLSADAEWERRTRNEVKAFWLRSVADSIYDSLKVRKSYRILRSLSRALKSSKMRVMHRLSIRAIGSPQDSWAKEAFEQYATRLRPFAKLELQELEEGQRSGADSDFERIRDREADALLRGISDESIVIACDERGKTASSEAFARALETWGAHGQPIVFCIGGSWGLHERVRQRATQILSFGAWTLPHQLARVVLIEQLYRAETIIHHKIYHK